jgi:hypothetical protein
MAFVFGGEILEGLAVAGGEADAPVARRSKKEL